MTLKDALDAVKHSVEKHTRFIRDPLLPPSDAELARRNIEDAWHGVVRPALHGHNKHNDDWMLETDNFFEIKKGYTVKDLQEHTKNIQSRIIDPASQKKAVSFFENATNLLSSFEHGVANAISKAWSGFCNAVSACASSSKKVEHYKEHRTR